jgi:hypothetical protein
MGNRGPLYVPFFVIKGWVGGLWPPIPILKPWNKQKKQTWFLNQYPLFLSIVQSSAGKAPWWEIPQNWSIFFSSGALCSARH